MRPIKEVKIDVDFVKIANRVAELIKSANTVNKLKKAKSLCSYFVFVAVSAVMFILFSKNTTVGQCSDLAKDLCAPLLLSCGIGVVSTIVLREIFELFIFDTKQVRDLLERINDKREMSDLLCYVRLYEKPVSECTSLRKAALQFLLGLEFLKDFDSNWTVLRALQTHECLVYLTKDANHLRIFDKTDNAYYDHEVKSVCSTVDGTENRDLVLVVNNKDMIVMERYALEHEAASVVPRVEAD